MASRKHTAHPTAAYNATTRLIYAIAAENGFSGISSAALNEVLDQVQRFVGALLLLSKCYADDGRRTRLNPLDLTQACEAAGISSLDLLQQLRRASQLHNKQGHTSALSFEPSLEELEGADEEEAALLNEEAYSDLPIQLAWLPSLPPAHTWQRGVLDPVFRSHIDNQFPLHADNIEEENAAISDQRIKTTRLVEKSLRNLIRSTTAATAQSLPEPPPVPVEEDVAMATAPASAPTFKLSISNRSIKVTEEKRLPPAERLKQLQSAANGVAEEVLDAGLINWETGHKRRTSQGPATKRGANSMAEDTRSFSATALHDLAINGQKRLRWVAR